MKDRSAFALAGIWEVWQHPAGIDIRTFAVLACAPNKMMSAIHNCMPVVLRSNDYGVWLSSEPYPSDLMKRFEADATTLWPITPASCPSEKLGLKI
ncbi:SOS response-associated peptidase family protein [Rhizobium etli]|uniref:SOS response-associated peptidase family protein n=1 Tax=Rhizobium etli TaxID=29449 RepID=UPI0028AB29C9|nr:SOS response-associated peptidase family protein [Rhizobium etli]